MVAFPVVVSGSGLNDSERVSTAVLKFPIKASEVQEPSERLLEIIIWLSET